MPLCPRVLFVNGGEALDNPPDQVRASGNVADTLEAALWAVNRTETLAQRPRIENLAAALLALRPSSSKRPLRAP